KLSEFQNLFVFFVKVKSNPIVVLNFLTKYIANVLQFFLYRKVCLKYCIINRVFEFCKHILIIYRLLSVNKFFISITLDEFAFKIQPLFPAFVHIYTFGIFASKFQKSRVMISFAYHQIAVKFCQFCIFYVFRQYSKTL